MTSDFLNDEPAIITQNRALPIIYNPLFGLTPENRLNVHGKARTTATIYSTRTLNDFRFNFKGNQQNEIYQRHADTYNYQFVPALIENEYQETTYLEKSAQQEVDAQNIKDFSILADKCYLIGDLALSSDVNTGQATIDFGNRGLLNTPSGVDLAAVAISTPVQLINALTLMGESLISNLQGMPSQVYFIIPSILRPLWNQILDGTDTLAGRTIDSGLSQYGGYTFAESFVYTNAADEQTIIAYIPDYVDLNVTVLPQIYKKTFDNYRDLNKTMYLSGTMGVYASRVGAVVRQPFTSTFFASSTVKKAADEMKKAIKKKQDVKENVHQDVKIDPMNIKKSIG